MRPGAGGTPTKRRGKDAPPSKDRSIGDESGDISLVSGEQLVVRVMARCNKVSILANSVNEAGAEVSDTFELVKQISNGLVALDFRDTRDDTREALLEVAEALDKALVDVREHYSGSADPEPEEVAPCGGLCACFKSSRTFPAQTEVALVRTNMQLTRGLQRLTQRKGSQDRGGSSLTADNPPARDLWVKHFKGRASVPLEQLSGVLLSEFPTLKSSSDAHSALMDQLQTPRSDGVPISPGFSSSFSSPGAPGGARLSVSQGKFMAVLGEVTAVAEAAAHLAREEKVSSSKEMSGKRRSIGALSPPGETPGAAAPAEERPFLFHLRFRTPQAQVRNDIPPAFVTLDESSSLADARMVIEDLYEEEEAAARERGEPISEVVRAMCRGTFSFMTPTPQEGCDNPSQKRMNIKLHRVRLKNEGSIVGRAALADVYIRTINTGGPPPRGGTQGAPPSGNQVAPEPEAGPEPGPMHEDEVLSTEESAAKDAANMRRAAWRMARDAQVAGMRVEDALEVPALARQLEVEAERSGGVAGVRTVQLMRDVGAVLASARHPKGLEGALAAKAEAVGPTGDATAVALLAERPERAMRTLLDRYSLTDSPEEAPGLPLAISMASRALVKMTGEGDISADRLSQTMGDVRRELQVALSLPLAAVQVAVGDRGRSRMHVNALRAARRFQDVVHTSGASKKVEVVVVGGGAGGAYTAAMLDRDPSLHVTLCDNKDFYEDYTFFCRHLARPDDAPCGRPISGSLVPHESYLRRGRVVCEPCMEVWEDHVVVGASRLRIPFDILVLAMGTRYRSQVKPVKKSVAFREAEIAAEQVKVRAAERVVIVGGGLVGVEMAAELAEAKVCPSVMLVSRNLRLVHDLGGRSNLAHERALEVLVGLGVDVRLGVELSEMAKGSRAYQLSDGTEVPVEGSYVTWAMGYLPNTDVLRTGGDPRLGEALDRGGFLQVDDHLRVPGLPHVFAVGDCVEARRHDGCRTSKTALCHALVVAANVARSARVLAAGAGAGADKEASLESLPLLELVVPEAVRAAGSSHMILSLGKETTMVLHKAPQDIVRHRYPECCDEDWELNLQGVPFVVRGEDCRRAWKFYYQWAIIDEMLDPAKGYGLGLDYWGGYTLAQVLSLLGYFREGGEAMGPEMWGADGIQKLMEVPGQKG